MWNIDCTIDPTILLIQNIMHADTEAVQSQSNFRISTHYYLQNVIHMVYVTHGSLISVHSGTSCGIEEYYIPIKKKEKDIYFSSPSCG